MGSCALRRRLALFSILLMAAQFFSVISVEAPPALAAARAATRLPTPSGGPACSRDYYDDSDGTTTKVETAQFSSDRRPVVYVHGFSSNEKMWTGGNDPAGILQNQVDNRIQNFLFNYSTDSVRWANNDKIAACLGQYISEIGEAYKSAGGDGKVLVVAHSMGGLAVLYSSSATFAQYPSGPYLGGVVTFDTPFLGSLWGGNNVMTYAMEGKQSFFNRQLLPMPGSDAGNCLAPHARGAQIPQPCAQPLPPALPSGVPLTTIQGNITITRKVLNIFQYSIPLNSDGIVSTYSSSGYREMFATDPGNTVDTSKVENCSITTGDVEAAYRSGDGPNWVVDKGTAAAKSFGVFLGSLYDLSSDGWSQLFHAFDTNGTSGADRTADLNMLTTLAIANLKAPCSHINIVHSQSALNKATEAIKGYLDSLDRARAAQSSGDVIGPPVVSDVDSDHQYVAAFCRGFAALKAKYQNQSETVLPELSNPAKVTLLLGYLDTLQTELQAFDNGLKAAPPAAFEGAEDIASRISGAFTSINSGIDDAHASIQALDVTSADFDTDAVGPLLGVYFNLLQLALALLDTDLASRSGITPDEIAIESSGYIGFIEQALQIPGCEVITAGSEDEIRRLIELARTTGNATGSGSGEFTADSPYHLAAWSPGDELRDVGYEDAFFKSPDGNIICRMYPAGQEPDGRSAVCRVGDHSWTAAPRPDTCTAMPLAWSLDMVSMDSLGARAGTCHDADDTYVVPADATVLQYGASLTFGSIKCDSDTSGITCTDLTMNGSFTVSDTVFQISGWGE